MIASKTGVKMVVMINHIILEEFFRGEIASLSGRPLMPSKWRLPDAHAMRHG
jgi:hypothetical protein